MHPLSGQKIIFLPGLDGTGLSFEPLRAALPDSVTAQVVRYPADRLLSFQETVACASGQIKADGASIVIAESFSGPVAVELIGSGMMQAKCLVLSATFARSPRPALLKLLTVLPTEFLVSLPIPRTVMRHIVCGGAEAADVFIGLVKQIRALVPARTIVHRLKVVDRLDVRHRLAGIGMPCLYLQADTDMVVPPSCLSDFIGHVPNMQVTRLHGPHFLLQARPGPCVEAIGQFLTSGGIVQPAA